MISAEGPPAVGFVKNPEAINLLGGNNSDAAVKAQIQSGIPELHAYDPDVIVQEGFTLERLHLTFDLHANVNNGVFIGVIKWPVDQTKYPMPEPVAEANSADWLAWQYITPAAKTSLVAPSGVVRAIFEIDIKSKRRIDEQGLSFFACADWNVAPTTGESLRIYASTLLKGGVH